MTSAGWELMMQSQRVGIKQTCRHPNVTMAIYSIVTIKPFQPLYMEKLLIHRVYSIYRSALIGGAESLSASHMNANVCSASWRPSLEANRTTKSRDEVLGLTSG